MNVWPRSWVSCPHAQQAPCLLCLPPFLPCALTRSAPNCCPDDESFQFTGFQPERGCYGFVGSPLVSGGRVGMFAVCCLALVAVLLASEFLPCVPGHSLPCLPFLLHPLPFYMDIGHCTGLSVCACMCAPVYTCIERYICGVGREWSAAQGLQPGHCTLEPVTYPSVLVR